MSFVDNSEEVWKVIKRFNQFPESYLCPEFLEHIDESDVNVILELGSRDGIDAVFLSAKYDADVYAFECNPDLIEECYSNTSEYERVTIINKAVWNEECEITFYPVINGNAGASSCFVATDDYPYEPKYEQKEVSVPAIRLDNWLNQNDIIPDLLCMDLQGAELNALKGMGDKLNHVKYIITEGQIKPMYHGINLINEIEEYLKLFGFSQIEEKLTNEFFGDYLFVKQ